MVFGTVINCMDGRVQFPVLEYVRNKYEVDLVDSITEAGPLKILSERREQCRITALREQLKISLEAHGSRLIAVAGHHDCIGNPVERRIQEQQIVEVLSYLKKAYGSHITFVGLYVNERGEVEEIKGE